MRLPILVCGAGAILVTACHSTPHPTGDTGGPRGLTHQLVGVTAVRDGAELPLDTLRALAPRIATLRLEPSTLVLHVGDTVSIRRRVRVLAVDSASTTLGSLPVYDSAMRPGAAAFVGIDLVGAQHVGVSRIDIRFPRAFWSGQPDARPTAQLRIEVRGQ